MLSAGSILRQLSGNEEWKSTSKKWVNGSGSGSTRWNGVGVGTCWKQMDGMSMYGTWENGYHHQSQNLMSSKKRVMVVVDETSRSKHAMMWALTHVTNNGDWLTLLHIICPDSSSSSSSSPGLARSLASLCKASKPQVEVEAIAIQGPKVETVLSQVKKLEVSVLVLGQKKPSPIISCLFGRSNTEEFVEKCINNAECLTIGVRKQSKSMGGYLISTRWQKNFWLLA
uniref:UspA domain-containing protein n=2 Tax=Opuntia streptacantha TaxID=393608 RepID=A0A7C9CMQ8_OPUST